MARLNLRLPDNVPGELYVDSSCIDCDMCREIAPSLFGYSSGDQSCVTRQPDDAAEWERALKALVACPTASIGAERSAKEASRSFPEPLDGPVFFCGYAAESSFGAHSYFVQRQDGNLLVDSPRAAKPLLQRIDALGGVRRMFLTHRDDVADHAAFHERYGCERILHREDVSRGTREVEVQPQGEEAREIAPGLVLIPVPGHTRGSCALLVDGRWLFTGDHLWADPQGRLEMGRSVAWYSWAEQKRSLRKLLDHSFEWVLPGHGRRVHLPAPRMRAEIERLAASA